MRLAVLPILSFLLPSPSQAAERLDDLPAFIARDLPSMQAQPLEPGQLVRWLELLGMTRDEAAVDVVAPFLLQGDPQVRMAAARALGWLPDADGPVLAALATEESPDVRDALWRALGQTGGPEVVGELLEGLWQDPPQRPAIAWALGLSVPPRAAEAEEASEHLARGLPGPGAGPVAGWDTPPEVAWALYRLDAQTLSRPSCDAVHRAWSGSPSQEVRGWLAPVVHRCLPAEQVDEFTAEVLSGRWHLARVRLLQRMSRDELSADQLRAALADPRPSVQGAAARLAGTGGGVRLPDETRELLRRVRGADAADLRTLLAGPDPVGRELAAQAIVGRHPQQAPGWLQEQLRVEVHPLVALTLVELLKEVGRTPRGWNRFDDSIALRRQVTARWEGGRSAVVDPLPRPAALPASATIRTTRGVLVVELDAQLAPLAVAAFTAMAQDGRYDGVIFHRRVPGVLLQTGDPRGDGMGGAPWLLPDELSDRAFVRGSLGMARGRADTASSQFFLTLSEQPQFAGTYTWFGRVVGGAHLLDLLGDEDRILAVTVEYPGEQ